MNNLESLKQELLLQKSVIESMGGVVNVANQNPSPSEITRGISSISVPDFSGADATEQDVLLGKKFYAGSNELKTGKFSLDELNLAKRHIFEYQEDVIYSERRFAYDIPTDIPVLRYGMFRDNQNYIDIYFNNAITAINSYAFNNTPNFRYFNFGEMDRLKTINSYAFEGANCDSIDFSLMPRNLETINQRAFFDVLKDGDSVVLPSSLKTMQQHTFYKSEKVYLNRFVIPSDCVLTALTTYALHNCICDSDLYVPSVTNIAIKFNYNGSFNNITLSENFTTMGDKCFSADSTRPISDCRLKTVTYLGETPPSVPTEPYAPQAVENGLKIYVPDQSVEAYKAKFSSRYTNCILPMSQKP